MSEQTAEAPATETEAAATEASAEQQAEQPKPSETVDFWKQKAREQEKRAKENADAAKRLAEIEEANLSEAEKTAKRIAELEQKLTGTRTAAFRDAAVRFGGISQEDADLFLTGSDEETLNKQLERLVARSDAQKKTGNFVPGEGTAPKSGEGSEGAFARQLFHTGD
jgi:hypothetical protein